MRETFETLLLQRSAGKLSRKRKREFLALVQSSAAFRHMAARDRLIDRLLRQSFRPRLEPEIILQALPPRETELAGRTMASITAAAPGQRSAKASRENAVQETPLRTLLAGLSMQWRAAFAVVLVVAATLTWFLFQGPAPSEIGRVAGVVGSPSRFGAKQKNPTELEPTKVIRFGDRIETGDADKAEIQFNDGTSLLLGFNTAVEVPTPKDLKLAYSRPPEVKLLRGEVWTKVQRATNATQYAIATDVATAVARGTEFGVKLRRTRAAATTSASDLSQQTTNEAVLTVKEGTVDFFNAHGTVQAIAMCESTARAAAAPTEPKRLQTLQTVQLSSGSSWELISSPLTWHDAADRLAGVAGFAGLHLATVSNGVQIVAIHSNSPAARANLQVGDVVLALEGQRITNSTDFLKQALLRPNTTASLRLLRAERELAVPLAFSVRTNALAPVLPPEAVAKINSWLRTLVSAPTNSATDKRLLSQALQLGSSTAIQAAACNNLGLLFELEDALGPAIRAYGRAVQMAANVPLYRLNLGQALRKIGSFDRALEEFEAATRLAPQSSAVQISVAEIHSLLGENTNAIDRVSSVLARAPQDHRAWELKTQLLVKRNSFAEALEAARKTVELEPHCSIGQGYLASALQGLGRLSEAEQVYKTAIALAPSSALLHMNLGTLYSARGNSALAEQSYRKAIELQPDFVLAYSNLGRLLGDRKQWREAEAALNTAAELAPDDLDAIDGLGVLAARQGHFEEAERQFRRVVELDSNNPAAHEKLASVYLSFGRDIEKAEVLYRKIIELVPSYAKAYTGLARILSGRGELAEAEQLWRKARDLAPNSSDIHNSLGEALRRQNKLDEAVQSYRKALELAPDNHFAINNLAIIHLMRGELTEAETMLRALINQSSQTGEDVPVNFLINLAVVCSRQGKSDEAEKLYRQALASHPNDDGICNNLAYLLAQKKRNLNEALTLARRAVTAAPNNGNYLGTLGAVLLHRGELDEAEQTLTKALELAGETPAAKQIREDLKEVQEKRGATNE